MAARDMRVEYHSSCIQSAKTTIRKGADRPAMTCLQLRSKLCLQCVLHVSQQVEGRIGGWQKAGRLGERMPK